jgi:hypothetical protein
VPAAPLSAAPPSDAMDVDADADGVDVSAIKKKKKSKKAKDASLVRAVYNCEREREINANS